MERFSREQESSMTEKILILGGTQEAVQLADRLIEAGHEVTLSLAGRTAEPLQTKAELRTGGFGGPEGLAEFLQENGYTRLVDATHPFAYRISENANQAAERTFIPFERLDRPPWGKRLGDNWTEFDSLEEARDALPAGARVFLALGSQHIAIFATREDIHFIVRMIDPPKTPLTLPSYEIVVSRPGITPESESDLFSQHQVTHLVCRNSGGERGYAKIEAARRLHLPVYMINRKN
jgi:precorrin-6A/cobalt-precorrin-6A reductase